MAGPNVIPSTAGEHETISIFLLKQWLQPLEDRILGLQAQVAGALALLREDPDYEDADSEHLSYAGSILIAVKDELGEVWEALGKASSDGSPAPSPREGA